MIYLLNPLVTENFSISRIGRCVTKAKADYLYPPTELLYVAAYLRKNGHQAKVIDGALLPNIQAVFEKIENPNYFIIMVGIFSHKIDSKFIAILKQKFSTTPIIVFGQGASFITEDYLDYADFVVFGEPEKPILEIIEKKKRIKGVSYKKNGKKIINKQINLLENLDEIPYPARDLIDNTLYRHAFFRPYAMVYSSRGCPYKCIFCTSKGYSPIYRVRSVENVIGELKEIYFRYKIKNLGFIDETFTINKNRVIKICQSIIKEKLKIKWIALARPDYIDEEMLKWMKKAGCKIILYGIESSNQKILNYLRKDVKVEKIEKIIKLTKKTGIETHGFFIFGTPLDTEETINETIEFAKKLKLDYASFNVYVPYPGTEGYKMLEKEDLIKTKDWSKYDQSFGELIYKNKNLKIGEIQGLIKKAYKKFYFNPRFILRRAKKDIINPNFLIRDMVNIRKILKNYIFE